MNKDDHDPVRKILKKWSVCEPLPPRFQEQVWKRIERAQAEQSASLWSLWCEWLDRVFARPAIAVSYVTVLLGVGLLAGYFKGQAQQQRLNDTLAMRYVQSIDPYQKGGHE